MKPVKDNYTALLDSIGLTIESARQNAFKAVNAELIQAYWELRSIHEHR